VKQIAYTKASGAHIPQRFLKPSLIREGAERSEAEGFFLSVSDAAKIKTLSFSYCRGEAAGKNPSVSGRKACPEPAPLSKGALRALGFQNLPIALAHNQYLPWIQANPYIIFPACF